MFFFRMSLALQMAIATILGIITGLFFGESCAIFSSFGDAYIMLLKATAIPYLTVAILHGIGQLNSFQAKSILKKGIMFIALAWVVNIAMIYLVYYVFPKAKGTTPGYISTEVPQINFAELLIPENIFYDLANNIIPAIVVFSLLLGIALMQIKEKEFLMTSFKNLVDALAKITSWIAKITPLGTFLIIANQAGTIQFATIKQISSYIILYILCVCTITFWIVPRIVSSLTHIKTYKWIKQLTPILLLAYTTNIVIISIPFIIELLRRELMSQEPFDEKSQTQIQGTVSLVFNLPLGSLFITLFVLFISIFYNHPLTMTNQLELFLTSFLTSLGAVGIGSWINSLIFMLDSLGLPQDAVSLYLTTIPFTSGFQAMLSVMQISTLSLLITLACRHHIRTSLSRITKECTLTFLPVIMLFALLKGYNPLPEIKNLKKSIYDLSIESGTLASKERTVSSEQLDGQDVFDKILQTKTLKVGYDPSCAPFCFFNHDKELVGFDIAFAYELAFDLGCSLEFIPLQYNTLCDDLIAGKYDIAMSAISVNEERLKKINFTNTYLQPRHVFVTIESLKKTFSSLEAVKIDTTLTIAVLKGTSYEKTAKELFPGHNILLIDSPDAFIKSQAMALLWEEQQAKAWSMGKRSYRVVFPQPSMGKDALAYAVSPSSERLISYLTRWLQLKESEGFTQKQKDLWIQGKTEIAAPYEKRWSILDNIIRRS